MNFTQRAFTLVILASTIFCVIVSSGKSDKHAQDNLGKMVTYLQKRMLNQSSLQAKIEVLDHAIRNLEKQIARTSQQPGSAVINVIAGYMGQLDECIQKPQIDSAITASFSSGSLESLSAKLKKLIKVRDTLRKIADYLVVQDAVDLQASGAENSAAAAEKNLAAAEEFTATIADDLHVTIAFLQAGYGLSPSGKYSGSQPALTASANGKYLASGDAPEYSLINLFNKSDNAIKLVCPTMSFTSKAQIYLTEEELGEALFQKSPTGYKIIQVRVKDQLDKDGGGSASCGYQSLLNGFIIARLLHSDPDQRASLLYELSSSALRIQLFGHQHSRWRSHVIESRKKTSMSNWIKSNLAEQCAEILPLTPLEQKRFTAVSGNVITTAVESLNLSPFHNKIAVAQQLAMQLHAAFVQQAQKWNEGLRDYFSGTKFPFHVQDIISAYACDPASGEINITNNYQDIADKLAPLLPLLNLNYEVRPFGIQNGSSASDGDKELVGAKWNKELTGSGSANTLPGEWLYSNEIKKLIRLEKKSGLLLKDLALLREGSKIRWAKLFDQTDENGELASIADEARFGLNPKLYAARELVKNRAAQGIYIFVICLPRHWITCVVNKVAHKPAQYILADSLNDNRIHMPQVIQLINFLEDVTPVQQSSGGMCVIS